MEILEQAKTTDYGKFNRSFIRMVRNSTGFFPIGNYSIRQNKNLDIYLKIKQFKITYKIYIQRS